MTADIRSDSFPECAMLAHCTRCDMPFAPQQEIEQTAALLKQAGANEEIVEGRRRLLQTCPHCKSNRGVHAMRGIKLTRFLPGAKAK